MSPGNGNGNGPANLQQMLNLKTKILERNYKNFQRIEKIDKILFIYEIIPDISPSELAGLNQDLNDLIAGDQELEDELL